jgi:hypothetical protein
MASFNSILSDVGNFFKKVFTSPITIGIEKGIDVFAQSPRAALVLSPAGATLLSRSVEAIENAELASIAVGAQNGSGPQKAALVMQQIEQAYNSFAAANNLPVTPASLKAFVDSFVAVANSFPAPTTAQPSATGTGSVAAIPPPSVTAQAKSGTLL